MTADKEEIPNYQEGSREFEVTLPSTVTKSGQEEKHTLAIRWELQVERSTDLASRINWEINNARGLLGKATSISSEGQDLHYNLRYAFAHAVSAWLLSHGQDQGLSHEDGYQILVDAAPPDLGAKAVDAHITLRALADDSAPPDAAFAIVTEAVNGLLEAASQTSGSLSRSPARSQSERRLVEKPQLLPGQWIETGRFRPAQVISIEDDPPHVMTVSYGDEIDSDFRPHIVDWQVVDVDEDPVSLKDLFSRGDQIQHSHFGRGHIFEVRDSTLDVKFGEQQKILAPDASLSQIQKIEPAV